jgi:hypothetical protein
MDGNIVVIDIEILCGPAAIKGEQSEEIPLPEQCVHLEFEDPSGSKNHRWATLEAIIKVFYVHS